MGRRKKEPGTNCECPSFPRNFRKSGTIMLYPSNLDVITRTMFRTYQLSLIEFSSFDCWLSYALKGLGTQILLSNRKRYHSLHFGCLRWQGCVVWRWVSFHFIHFCMAVHLISQESVQVQPNLRHKASAVPVWMYQHTRMWS